MWTMSRLQKYSAMTELGNTSLRVTEHDDSMFEVIKDLDYTIKLQS
jgi:hypothetical protein